MNEANTNETQNEKHKKTLHVNYGILFGLLGGAALGIIIGKIARDIPLYTGFGMILGMAISFDISAHIKSKKQKGE